MTRRQYVIYILILGALSTVSPFSIDMYLPAFPSIAEHLHTTISEVQLSLTAYLLGIAAGQLLYGPLLDRFGRRPPLYAGLVVYLAASVGCAFSPTIEMLIFMRFLQALGGCAGMVAAQTLVRDLFPVNKIAQAFSSITLVIAVSPMIAPTIGGYMTVAMGWQSVFIILAAVCAIIMVGVYFYLPQGRAGDSTILLAPKHVLKNFGQVIIEPQFLMYGLAGGIAMSAPFAFISGSSDVFINQYGVSERHYGWVFASVASAVIGSSQLNHFLLRRYTSQQLVKFALVYQSVLGITLVLGAYLGWLNLYSLIALSFVFLCGQGLVAPNTNALALAPFVRHTGSAASLLGSFRMAVGGAASALVSMFHTGTELPMVAVMVLCSVLGLIILLSGSGVVRYRALKKVAESQSAGIV